MFPTSLKLLSGFMVNVVLSSLAKSYKSFNLLLEESKKEGSGTQGWKYVGEYSSHIDTIAGVQYCNVMYWGADTASIETGDDWTIKGDFYKGGRDMEDKLPKMSG